MGGFVDGTTLLSLNDIERLVRSKEIEYPIVTREEIQDKSKGDAVTKALVVLQTTWFLLQCAARGSQHLALTELELATAAFALRQYYHLRTLVGQTVGRAMSHRGAQEDHTGRCQR